MSFIRTANVPCSTKRKPAPVGVKISSPVEYLTGLYCTPIDPVDPNDRLLPTNAPVELKETFLTGDPDIIDADILVAGGEEYRVEAVGEWAWRSTVYKHLFVQEWKGQ